MEKNTRNIFLIAAFCVGIIFWYMTKVAAANIVNYFAWGLRFSWAHIVENILPVVIGGLAAYLVYGITKVREYLLEVITEVKKVIWPSKKETWGATVVVIIAVIISAIVLGIFDWLAGLFMNFILR